MGCNCCRILQSCMLEQEGPQVNTRIVEAHSYKGHGHSNSQTIKISDLKNEGYITTEQDGFNETLDVDSITKDNNAINDDATSTGTSTVTSSYPILEQSLKGDVEAQNSYSSNHHDVDKSDCPAEDSNGGPGCEDRDDAHVISDETSIVAQMIIKHSSRSGKKRSSITSPCNGMLLEEDNDGVVRDVAEALAVLDAVIAKFEKD